jgi:hypothetical protein
MDARSKALKAKLETEGRLELSLKGRCMDPLLVDGDRVAVVPLADLEVGTLYLVELPAGDLAVHRLVRLSDGRAICKGDRAGKFDDLGTESLIGRVNEVRLKDSDTWHTVDTGRTAKRRIARLSLGLCKDKEKDPDSRIASLRRSLSLAALRVYLRYSRRRWRA